MNLNSLSKKDEILIEEIEREQRKLKKSKDTPIIEGLTKKQEKKYDKDMVDYDNYEKNKNKKQYVKKEKIQYSNKKRQYVQWDYSYLNKAIKVDPGPITLWHYLRQNEVSWKKKVDKFSLYEEYYLKRGLICVSISTRELGVVFGVERRTIGKWIKKLEENDIIKVEKIKENKKNFKIFNIFVIGYVVRNNSITTKYYYIGDE